MTDIVRIEGSPDTLDELVSFTLRGLLAQGGPSGVIIRGDQNYFSPRYRDAEGRACAIGLWIPDNEYRLDMEGYLPFQRPNMFPKWMRMPAWKRPVHFVQLVHDNAARMLDRKIGTWEHCLVEAFNTTRIEYEFIENTFEYYETLGDPAATS